MQLSKQPVEPVAHVAELPELARKVGERSVQVEQKYSIDPVGKLTLPRITNLLIDPQEREPVSLPHLHIWVVSHFNRLLGEFKASVEREPPVPSDAPLDFVPKEEA
jgi:hypothetical protein